MNGTLLLIVGVSGSGKSTLLEALRLHRLKILQPSTTRIPRAQEIDSYEFLDNNEWHSTDFAWETEIRNAKYGVKKEQIDGINKNFISVSFFHESLLYRVQDLSEEYGINIVVVMLDTIQTVAEQTIRVLNDLSRVASSDAFLLEQINNIKSRSDLILRGSKQVVEKAVLTTCYLLSSKGVLAKKDIKALLEAGSLLDGAIMGSIEPCSYDLHLGDEIWCRGKITKLSSDNLFFQLPAYSYAIVKAKELAAIPTFIVARFDLTVGMFFRGLILSNGPQVDPGYRGALFCLLFNASDANVPLKYGEHMATVEFTVSSRPAHAYNGQHQGKKSLGEFLDKEAGSSKGGNIVTRIKELENKVKRPFLGFLSVASILFVGIAGYVAMTLIKMESISKQIDDNRQDIIKNVDLVKDKSTEVKEAINEIGPKIAAAEKAKMEAEDAVKKVQETFSKMNPSNSPARK